MKQYISILEILPHLLADATSDGETYIKTGSDMHFFQIAHTDEATNQMTFSNLTETFYSLSTELADYYQRHFEATDFQSEEAPFVMAQPYAVPNILEFEFIKRSYYGETFPEEIMSYIERMMMQYVIWYERIQTRDTLARNLNLYTDTSETGPFYTNIQDQLHELDLDSEEGVTEMNRIINEAYQENLKMKILSKANKAYFSSRVLVETTAERMFSYVDSSSQRQESRIEMMLRSLPLLTVYTTIESQQKSDVLATYEDYDRTLQGFPANYRQFTFYERDDIPMAQITETPTQLFTNGNTAEHTIRNTNVDTIDADVVRTIYPHILDQFRRYYLGDDVSISSENMARFNRESWASKAKPSMVLNESELSWEVSEDVSV